MKTIIEMARVAGVRDDGHRFEFSEYKYLELFVALVRADEREACAQLCESYIWSSRSTAVTVINDCAATIRARGNT